MIGINKPLWIAVNNGEPGTLNLNHQSVSRQECVCHIIPVSYTHLDVYKRQGLSGRTDYNQRRLQGSIQTLQRCSGCGVPG